MLLVNKCTPGVHKRVTEEIKPQHVGFWQLLLQQVHCPDAQKQLMEQKP